MDNNLKIENLKFIIGRYDHYIESTQTKSNVYISLNTAVIAGVITIISALELNKMCIELNIILLLIAILAVIGIVMALVAVKPNLLNKKSQDSIIFFNDVSSYKCKEFLSKVKNIEEDGFLTDMSIQAHNLASVLSKKYCLIKWVGKLIKLEFILLIIWLIIFMSN